MRKSLLFILFLVSPLLGGGGGFLFAQDRARLAERSVMGTARYVAMGGAMSAVGGDPTAALDNPAGLGLYQRSEVMLTLDYSFDRTIQSSVVGPEKRHYIAFPQASVVFSRYANPVSGSGLQYYNFMFSYRRMNSFGRTMYAEGAKDASLGALFASTGVDMKIPYCTDRTNSVNNLLLKEYGYANEYALDWAANISNRWYVGVGLHMQSYSMTSEADFYEDFARTNATGLRYSNSNRTSVAMSGVGCNLSLGAICRPTRWLRLGLAVQTPSLGSVNTYTSGVLRAQTDSLRASSISNGSPPSRSYHAPLRTTASVAFQFGYFGMLALQYDYSHASYQHDIHSLRAGLEIIPVPGMYINAGYVYESTFRTDYMVVPVSATLDRQDAYFQFPKATQYASVGLGYRGQHVIVQAAYQYRWQNLKLFAHEYANPYDMHADTHRVVLTFAWHRGW